MSEATGYALKNGVLFFMLVLVVHLVLKNVIYERTVAERIRAARRQHTEGRDIPAKAEVEAEDEEDEQEQEKEKEKEVAPKSEQRQQDQTATTTTSKESAGQQQPTVDVPEDDADLWSYIHSEEVAQMPRQTPLSPSPPPPPPPPPLPSTPPGVPCSSAPTVPMPIVEPSDATSIFYSVQT